MSKRNFRLLLLLTLFISILASAYDYIWPDILVEKTMAYVLEIEPEMSIEQLIIVAVLTVIAIIMALASFVGLMLFKSWSRYVYSIGFSVVFLLYPIIGISVYSGISQIFYDLSMVLSGIIIGLIYTSPLSEHFEKSP